MCELFLVNISKKNLISFKQYIPQNILGLIDSKNVITIGCVYKDMSCGCIVAELENGGDCRLLSIYVDENVRNCSIAKYMFLGLLGELYKLDIKRIYFCYTDTQIKDFDQLKFLMKLGFDNIRKNGVSYTFRYGDLKCIKMFSNANKSKYSFKNIIRFSELSSAQVSDYKMKVQEGVIPSFLSIENAKGNIIPELTLAAVKDDSVAGIFSMTDFDNYIYVNSVYAIKNSYNELINLIKYAFLKSVDIVKENSLIKVTACNEASDRLCRRVLKGLDIRPQTEYLMEYYL